MDAADVAGAFLPMTVAYQWSCMISNRTNAETVQLPPDKPDNFPAGAAEVYLALQTDTFYLDKGGKFINQPKTEPPETWIAEDFAAGPGYRRYKIKYTLKQQMAIRRNDTSEAPVPSFDTIQFSGLLSSGYYSGSFLAVPVGGNLAQRVTYDCYQKKWWPLAPSGW